MEHLIPYLTTDFLYGIAFGVLFVVAIWILATCRRLNRCIERSRRISKIANELSSTAEFYWRNNDPEKAMKCESDCMYLLGRARGIVEDPDED